jgi:hypothetical protein
VAAAGLAVLTRLDATSGYLSAALPAEVLVGIGMGMVFPPAFSLAVRGVTQRDAGVASAVINASTQVGSSIGTAVLNTLAVSATAAYVADHAASPALHTAALVHGYTVATGWSSGLLAVMAVVVFVVASAPRPSTQARSTEEE